MTCERCGHAVIEHRVIDPYHTVDECIANLRADLAFLRAAKDGRDAEFAQALADLEAEHERANEAEAQCAVGREAAAQVAETQPFYPDTHTGMRQQWVKLQIAARIRALDPPDAGRDLLTAVRRLCEAAHAVLHEDIHEERSYGALDAALADPALAGVRGAP